jgi:hypothetical protein
MPEYLTNRKGEKTAVKLSVDEFKQVEKELNTYRKFHKDYTKLRQLGRFMRGIDQAFRELEEIVAGRKKARTLDEVIRELKESR